MLVASLRRACADGLPQQLLAGCTGPAAGLGAAAATAAALLAQVVQRWPARGSQIPFAPAWARTNGGSIASSYSNVSSRSSSRSSSMGGGGASSSTPAAAAVPAAAARLAAALGVAPAEAARMCARHPYLLDRDPRELAAAAAALQDLLRLPSRADLLRRVLRGHPQLLSQDPAAIAARAAALQARLGAAREDVLSMCARQPALLYSETETVLAKVAALVKLLELPPARGARFVAAWPTLAMLSASSVADKLSRLMVMLGVDRAEAARLCRANPQLLICSTRRVAANHAAWAATAAGSGHGGSWRTRPTLLTSPAERLAARWRLLAALAPLHAPWAAWFARGGGAGGVLLLSAAAWQRAEYAVERLVPGAAAGGAPTAAGGAPTGGGPSGGGPSNSDGGGSVYYGFNEEPLLLGAPGSFRQLLVTWSDADMEAWLPGFHAWRDARPVEPARGAGRAAAARKPSREPA
ncbi:MAG: hypothetical protein J3K34DRAFT_499016 [Monoraphidium minutum]|nr:MAG: hypothetical protein J3K34DRAFT_499016 [Monoraphidium minutum]